MSFPIDAVTAGFLGAGISIGLGSIGAGIGEGLAAGETVTGMERQPAISSEILTNMLIGQAVTESAAIFSLVIAILLIFGGFTGSDPAALLGAGLSMGVGALGCGVGSGMTAQRAQLGIARNPHARGPVTVVMLLGQAVSQTPAIFSLVISLLLILTPEEGGSTARSAALISSGLCMGMGAAGAGLGSGIAGASGAETTARAPAYEKNIITAMLVGQAVSQTPAVFALVVSLLLYVAPVPEAFSLPVIAALMGAGIAGGVGGVGPGVGAGFTAARAVEGIARIPQSDKLLIRVMLTGQAVAQSTAIYAMVVALLLLKTV